MEGHDDFCRAGIERAAAACSTAARKCPPASTSTPAALIARGLFMALGLTIATVTPANEASFKLKPGTGVEVVQRDCMVCHSADYIESNSPFLDEKMWQAEVAKMIKAFGAQVPNEDVGVIVEYLTRTYGAASKAESRQ